MDIAVHVKGVCCIIKQLNETYVGLIWCTAGLNCFWKKKKKTENFHQEKWTHWVCQQMHIVYFTHINDAVSCRIQSP